MDVQSSIVLLEEDLPAPPAHVHLPKDYREAANWQGRQGLHPIAVVEHIAVAPTFDGLVGYLAGDNAPEVSATFVIGGDYVGQWALLVGSGQVRNLKELPLDQEELLRAANHAGIQSFPNNNPHPEWGNPNWWTWGKEHVGYPGQIWSEAMIQNDLDCNAYVTAILGAGAFSSVLGHHDFDPINRANCPGPTFPWGRIYGRTFAAAPRVPELLPVMQKIPIEELHKLGIGDWEGYNDLLKRYS